MRVMSSAFEEGGTIPTRYTCDGADISPPLRWEGVPEGTKSIAIICDDPDAPMETWVHWVVFNVSPRIVSFAEAVDVVRDGAIVGTNSWGKSEYGGPCPPTGVHRYNFKLYALEQTLTLDKYATKQDLENAMRGHILDEAQLMARYKRIAEQLLVR